MYPIAPRIFFTVLFACLALKMAAQTCNGSLGDPVIYEDFGSGSDPGAALPAGTTNYPYSGKGCPPDGTYTIASNIGTCYNGTWHIFNQDHTGNPNGYMMVVNASKAPGIFYTQTTKPGQLCPNTTYEFAAWITNLDVVSNCNYAALRPNITFSIETTDGEVLQTGNTGDIEPTEQVTWKQYRILFTTHANTTAVVVKMTNNASGGCGNDLALDDITFRACGPIIESGFSSVSGPDKMVLCQGADANYTLKAAVVGEDQPSYQWQANTNGAGWVDVPGENSDSYDIGFTNAVPGSYQYRLGTVNGDDISSLACRVYSKVMTVDVDSLPQADAGKNIALFEGQSAKLNGSIKGDSLLSYSWSPGRYLDKANTLNPTTTPDNDILYALTVVSKHCGIATSTVFVKVYKKVSVPNAFSPNGDGINDLWNVKNLATYPESTVRVFNRYGSVVFQSQGYARPWDGTSGGIPLPAGTYYYIIDLNNNQPRLTGWVLLVK